MTKLFVYFALALGVSFVCSILEAALLSVTPSHIAKLEQDRPKVGSRLRALKSHIDRPLAAILSLNTIANTAGAAGVGAEAQRLWGSEALAIASAILTFGILVVSEILPKTLGAMYWRRLTGLMATVLPAMILILLPLVWLSQAITRSLKRRRAAETLSREEFAALARVGEEQGVFDESEMRILRNLFHFGSLRTRDIMTPRTVMFSLEENMTVRDAVAERGSMIFSRIPIWNESPDQVTGYILKDQLLLRAARDELDAPLRSFAREALMVPDTIPLPSLFEKLLDNREHIAVVVDEYGGIDGVVTMEDVLETLIGLEIVDEMDSVQDMRAMARAKWEARAKRAASELPEPPKTPPAGGS
ncbi:MAG: HlyC/CorC family transporter [Myxococcales bacterium]|nr:MAG: HlyC/CorC family transporter [Myxococcales bacterium]